MENVTLSWANIGAIIAALIGGMAWFHRLLKNDIKDLKLEIKQISDKLSEDIKQVSDKLSGDIKQVSDKLTSFEKSTEHRLTKLEMEAKSTNQRLTTIEGFLMPRKIYRIERSEDDEPKEN